MLIRTRLLIILLGTALAPLAVTSLVNQVSISIARHRLTANTQLALDTNARLALQEQLQNHVEILRRDRQLTLALLERQALEVELALGRTGRPRQGDVNDSTFGFDPNLPVPIAHVHPVLHDTNDPNIAALQVDYRRQSYAIAPQANREQALQVLDLLESLTAVYHKTYREMPKGALWLHTRLNIGVHTRYPAGGEIQDLRVRDQRRGDRPPADRPPGDRPPGDRAPGDRAPGDRAPADRAPGDRAPADRAPGDRPPGDRPPSARQTSESRGDGLMVDPATNQVVVVTSVPIHRTNGTVAGTTSMTRTIPEIFEDMALPQRWGTEVERMLVRVDPNTVPGQGVETLLRDDLTKRSVQGRRRVVLGALRSDSAEQFSAMVNDILAGRSGVGIMDHKGRSCVWAYQPIEMPGEPASLAALLIVPYEQVTALAREMEQSLLRESMFWLQTTTIVLLIAGVCAVVLAAVRARSLTRPIVALTEAGKRLASGDYDAQVLITTGDELEQLGRVFNETGPKLRERERMKRSLELAAAIQQSLLPKNTPDLNHFDVAGRCVCCDETGGDCYDFIELPGQAAGRLGIAVADVSGHGFGPSLLMATARGILRVQAPQYSDDLPGLFDRLNRQLIEDMDDDKFVTLLYGVLDDSGRSLTWASAGHEPALWYQARTKHVEVLPNTGMPLGISHTAAFEQAGPIVLAGGDVVVMGTDGIAEAQDAEGRFFGRDRLVEVVRENAHLSADEICTVVIQAVTAFIQPMSRTDDITLVVIKAKCN